MSQRYPLRNAPRNRNSRRTLSTGASSEATSSHSRPPSSLGTSAEVGPEKSEEEMEGNNSDAPLNLAHLLDEEPIQIQAVNSGEEMLGRSELGHKAPQESAEHKTQGSQLSPANRSGDAVQVAVLDPGRLIAQLEEMSRKATKDFARFPDRNERKALAETIEQMESAVGWLNGEILSTQAKTHRLTRLRDDGVRTVNHYKAFRSTIRLLAPEIVAYVCRISAFQDGTHPLRLASISRQFREAMLRDSSWWSFLIIRDDHPALSHYDGGYYICRTVTDIQVALKHSLTAPLTIKVQKCDRAMAQLLAAARDRWLEITYDSGQALGVGMTLFGDGISFHNFISQTTFRLAQSTLWWWDRVRALSIVGCGVQGSSEGQWDQSRAIWQLLSVLRTNLIELSISKVVYSFMESRIDFPNVTKLTLLNVPDWWQFSAQKTTELHLRLSNVTPPPPFASMDFPHLVSLQYFANDQNLPHGCIRAPKLGVLNCYHYGELIRPGSLLWEGPSIEGVQSTPVFTLRILHIHGINGNLVEHLDLALNGLTKVTEIYFHSSWLTLPFLKRMAGLPLLLPSLEVMKVELIHPSRALPGGLVGKVRKTYVSLFESIVRVRKQNGDKLRALDVKWSAKMDGEVTRFIIIQQPGQPTRKSNSGFPHIGPAPVVSPVPAPKNQLVASSSTNILA